MSQLKNSNCNKTYIYLSTKLNSSCEKMQKLKLWQNLIHILTNFDQTKIVRKLKNLSCDKTQMVTKLKISNGDKAQKLKLWQNQNIQIATKLNSNSDHSTSKKNSKTQTATKLNNLNVKKKKIMSKLKNSNSDSLNCDQKSFGKNNLTSRQLIKCTLGSILQSCDVLGYQLFCFKICCESGFIQLPLNRNKSIWVHRRQLSDNNFSTKCMYEG